jgi:hypothetical protein
MQILYYSPALDLAPVVKDLFSTSLATLSSNVSARPKKTTVGRNWRYSARGKIDQLRITV